MGLPLIPSRETILAESVGTSSINEGRNPQAYPCSRSGHRERDLEHGSVDAPGSMQYSVAIKRMVE